MSTKLDLRMLDGTVITGVSVTAEALQFTTSAGTTIDVPLAMVAGGGITKEIIKAALGYEPLGALTSAQLVSILGMTPISNAFVQAGAVFEIGRYIDFHAQNLGNDYDVRLECTLPESGAGTASLNVWAKMIYTNGSLRVDGNISGLSDLRKKHSVRAIENSLAITAQLHGITYVMKDDEKNERRLGLAAQDVLKAIPEAVDQSDPDCLAVIYGNLAGLFVENIKALVAENAELRRVNETFEQRLKRIEGRVGIVHREDKNGPT